MMMQGPDSAEKLPLGSAFSSSSSLSSRLFWQYEVSIQLEPLQDFCRVVRAFKPDDLLLLVLNKVVRPLLKKVSFRVH